MSSSFFYRYSTYSLFSARCIAKSAASFKVILPLMPLINIKSRLVFGIFIACGCSGYRPDRNHTIASFSITAS